MCVYQLPPVFSCRLTVPSARDAESSSINETQVSSLSIVPSRCPFPSLLGQQGTTGIEIRGFLERAGAGGVMD